MDRGKSGWKDIIYLRRLEELRLGHCVRPELLHALLELSVGAHAREPEVRYNDHCDNE